jgi:hypothetical protein
MPACSSAGRAGERPDFIRESGGGMICQDGKACCDLRSEAIASRIHGVEQEITEITEAVRWGDGCYWLILKFSQDGSPGGGFSVRSSTRKDFCGLRLLRLLSAWIRLSGIHSVREKARPHPSPLPQGEGEPFRGAGDTHRSVVVERLAKASPGQGLGQGRNSSPTSV